MDRRSTVWTPKAAARRPGALPEPIGSMALRSEAAARSCRSAAAFICFDFEYRRGEAHRETQPGNCAPRLNDGKVDRHGRFVAGSMDFEERDAGGKLFRLDPDLSVHTARRRDHLLQRTVLEPGRQHLLLCRHRLAARSTPTTTTSRPANVRSRRLFACFDKLRGFPDGATVDEEGYRLERRGLFRPADPLRSRSGVSIASSACRSSRPRASASAAPNLDIAFVTSMARPMGGHTIAREAGWLFAVHGLGVRGLPEPRFAG